MVKGYPVGHPRRYSVRDPNGKIRAYGKTPKDAWHNLYVKEKQAERVATDGGVNIPFGFNGVDQELKRFLKGCGL